MAIRVDLANYDEVMRGLEDCPKDLAKGVRKTMLAMRAKSGGVLTVARDEVTQVYNISKKDVSAKYKGYREVGSISLAGVKIPLFEVEFEQTRTFTPTHFGMTPKKRYVRNRPYVVQFKPLKTGGKIPLKSDSGFPVFLAAPSGAMLPWNRLGKARKPIEVIRTHLAVPQMIDNPKVQPNMQREVERRMEKLLGENL